MMASFIMKRQTGGISYQHNGCFWDGSEYRSTGYTTSVNSAATAASTNDIKKDSNDEERA